MTAKPQVKNHTTCLLASGETIILGDESGLLSSPWPGFSFLIKSFRVRAGDAEYWSESGECSPYNPSRDIIGVIGTPAPTAAPAPTPAPETAPKSEPISLGRISLRVEIDLDSMRVASAILDK